MTHTPAPWRIDETNASGNYDEYHIFIQPNVAVIERSISGTHDMADARLICAAPLLLEALIFACKQSPGLIENPCIRGALSAARSQP